MDYIYDQLSRLKEETRLFDVGGVTRSFTLKYEYNLAGQLNQITDPWNATIAYNRNEAGQETGVTGTGYKDQNPNQDVNVFASNIKYRAWGGIKEFTNGSLSGNTAFAMGYDARMRLTSYTGNGRTTEHDYYNDGQIKEVRDLHYGSNFLRKYEYDHVGRLTKAHAGGTAQTSSSPYSLTYGYDAWGHSTSRQGSHWSQALPSFSTTYANDRDTNMTYDAAGNVKVYYDSSEAPWIHYNATSQLFTQLEGIGAPGLPSIRENYYDGNGAKANYIIYNGSLYNGVYQQSSITYLIRSSVLDGKVIAEFLDLRFLTEGDPNKYSGKTYVYLKGVQLAIQEGAEEVANGFIYWIHHNPIVGNLFWERRFSSQYLTLNEMAFDPVGTFVGIAEPQPIVVPDFLANFASQLYFNNHSENKCYADGVQSSCNLVYSALNNGYGMEAPWGTTSVGMNQYSTSNPAYSLHIDWDNGYYGFVPTGARVSGDGYGGWFDPNTGTEGRLGNSIRNGLPSQHTLGKSFKSELVEYLRFHFTPECVEAVGGKEKVEGWIKAIEDEKVTFHNWNSNAEIKDRGGNFNPMGRTVYDFWSKAEKVAVKGLLDPHPRGVAVVSRIDESGTTWDAHKWNKAIVGPTSLGVITLLHEFLHWEVNGGHRKVTDADHLDLDAKGYDVSTEQKASDAINAFFQSGCRYRR